MAVKERFSSSTCAHSRRLLASRLLVTLTIAAFAAGCMKPTPVVTTRRCPSQVRRSWYSVFEIAKARRASVVECDHRIDLRRPARGHRTRDERDPQ